MLLVEISGNCRKDKDYVMDVDKKDRNEILVAMIIYTLMLVLPGQQNQRRGHHNNAED